jgi:hypothetical protein
MERLMVSSSESFTTLLNGSLRARAGFRATVEDDHAVVDRVTHDRQQRRDKRAVDFDARVDLADKREQADQHQHVVYQRHDAGDGVTQTFAGESCSGCKSTVRSAARR